MANPRTRKTCVVPNCVNTTTNAPEKLFFTVPGNPEMRKKWTKAMKRAKPLSQRSCVYCCQDHFDIENDMENYMKFKMVGGRLRLKIGVIPHKFECQDKKDDDFPSKNCEKNSRLFKELAEDDSSSIANETPEYLVPKEEIIIEEEEYWQDDERTGEESQNFDPTPKLDVRIRSDRCFNPFKLIPHRKTKNLRRVSVHQLVFLNLPVTKESLKQKICCSCRQKIAKLQKDCENKVDTEGDWQMKTEDDYISEISVDGTATDVWEPIPEVDNDESHQSPTIIPQATSLQPEANNQQKNCSSCCCLKNHHQTEAKDEFYHFGQNIACQLRKLPLKSALRVEVAISNMIAKERLTSGKKVTKRRFRTNIRKSKDEEEGATSTSAAVFTAPCSPQEKSQENEEYCSNL